MGKKILVLGTGAQGSTVAQRMDEEPNVSEIICADYDEKAVNELVKILKKASGLKVDANDVDSIVAAAEGCDLIVNALPIAFAPKVLDAALRVKANYQDFAATDVLDPWWPTCVQMLYDNYGDKFKEIGRMAIIRTWTHLCCYKRCNEISRYMRRYTDDGIRGRRSQAVPSFLVVPVHSSV